ncbi:MAG: hypothetical protein D5R98_07410 [Desulfonatronovibrio sp. MSAO_Bac4]|nr:MAG: hypothetical protein D5R98_07410 [Desulfonatronovibrio sp. MSAO_Bac4]
MQAQSTIEKRLIEEIKELDQEETEKIIKMIHFMKEEILKGKQKGAKPDIMKYASMLGDMSSEENELFEQAVQRKSIFKNRKLEL